MYTQVCESTQVNQFIMNWGQEEMGTTEDEMTGWYHQLYGRGFA